MSQPDDAGVYKVSDDLALIQTVDFFTPIVDDPYAFGQIAVANALSDVYAMGGVPRTAMNIVCFPLKKMDLSILRRILAGGLDKLKEAGVVLVGGHSVEDNELKYGLSVTGLVHPDRILIKRNLTIGARLILTKPLGTGIVNTAIKADLASPQVTEMVIALMSELNRKAADVINNFSVCACTDITGFGLAGHMAEMVVGSGHGIRIDSGELPIIEEALDYAAMGLIPAGAYKNREFRSQVVKISPLVDRAVADILFDPQTSGGLLICVDSSQADQLLNTLHEKGLNSARMIGEVTDGPEAIFVE
jgi:selenide,water dikinase